MSQSKDELLQEIMNNMAAIRRLMATCMQRLDRGVTPSQAEVLMIVHQDDPITQKELGKLMQLTPGAITQLVEQVERLGYVQRKPSTTDRRVTHVVITPQGQEAVSVVKSQKEDLFKHVYQELTLDEIKTMDKVQKKMITYLKTKSNVQ